MGKALRAKIWWVKAEDEIFLIMDNTGGFRSYHWQAGLFIFVEFCNVGC